jgi:hypothetical protein
MLLVSKAFPYIRTSVNTVTCMSDCRRGFGLGIGFTDHLYTRFGTTNSYSAIANIQTLQIARAHSKFLPACCVFTSLCLVTSSNSGDSSASALRSSLNGCSLPTKLFSSQTPVQNWLGYPSFLLYNSSARPAQTTSFFCCMRIRCRGNVFTEPFPNSGRLLLRICCLATDVVPLSVSPPLPGK